MDDFDDDIWQHEKHKMIMEENIVLTSITDYFMYEIEENIAIRNIKLKIKYNENFNKNYDEQIMFDNLDLEMNCEKYIISSITVRFNNFIASLLGIKNSICLIPIILKNLNSYIFLRNKSLIILKYKHQPTCVKYIDKVYIEYEKLKNVSKKKIESIFLVSFEQYRSLSDKINYINYKYKTCLNFVILKTSFDFKNHKGKKKLEFNEMILNICYCKNKKIAEYKKIKINFDNIVVKHFLGDIFYVIFLDEKMTNIKNIAHNYHKKNEDKKIMYYIEEVQFVPDIKIYGSIYFYVF